MPAARAATAPPVRYGCSPIKFFEVFKILSLISASSTFLPAFAI